jgi:NAD-dependent SIR2 family protein deacetylase
MPAYAVESGAKLMIVNLSETPMDEKADVLIRARAGETMTKIAGKVAEKVRAD